MAGYADIDGLPRANPSALDLSAAAIDAMLEDLSQAGIEMHSFMLARDGAVAAEGWWSPYRPDRVHMLHSVTKAFTSTGVGLALDEKLFSLDDRVVDFFPDHLPPTVSENLAAMTVRHLLTQTSGHDRGVSGSVWRRIPTSWINEFLKIPVPHKPGTRFQYSSATSFMLSAIVTRTSGSSLHDYLKPRLFEPLGMDSVKWDVGPEGINPGGNGASATSGDLLKFAVLHAADGIWKGSRILPEGWVEGASTPVSGNPYGYHWWVKPGAPGFFAFGAFGQYAFVIPQWRLALVTTAAVPGSISVPDIGIPPIIWEHLPRIVAGADADSEGAKRLSQRLAGPRLPTLQQAGGNVQALPLRTFVADPNEDGITALTLQQRGNLCELTIAIGGKTHLVEASLDGEPHEGVTTLPGAGLHHGYEPEELRYVASAGWEDRNELVILCRYPETAFADTLRLRLNGNSFTFDRSVNVNGGAVVRPTVNGHSA